MAKPFEDIRERVRQRNYLAPTDISMSEYEDSIRLLSAVDALMDYTKHLQDKAAGRYAEGNTLLEALPPEIKEAFANSP